MQDAFDHFGLAPSFFPDATTLKKKFYQLSRQYHPDFLTQASPEEKEQALENMAALNKAYVSLQDPQVTMALVLHREGLLTEEEKPQLPPDFLMVMMEINEGLEDLNGKSDPESVTQRQSLLDQVKELQASLGQEMEPLLKAYGQPGFDPQQLLPVKTYYFQLKYLNRLVENAE